MKKTPLLLTALVVSALSCSTPTGAATDLAVLDEDFDLARPADLLPPADLLSSVLAVTFIRVP